jgi:pimeloyl-ACP methyl ester carboxylesterase
MMMSLLSSPVFMNYLYYFLTFYFVLEAVFAVVYFCILIPQANHPCQPAPYRQYGKDRRKLLLRILHRIEETCELKRTDPKQTIISFLSDWFHIQAVSLPSKTSNDNNAKPKDRKISDIPILSMLSSSSWSSPENSDDDHEYTKHNNKVPFCLYKEDVDSFFAWTFFAKDYANMLGWELKELNRIYEELETRHNITFPPKTFNTSPYFHPRRMTLEPVVPLYRPLAVYLGVMSMKLFGRCVLYLYGFQRYVTISGLVSWYRPAKNETDTSLLPLLFFHGIAPGGFVVYLPMVLYGLSTENDRAVFLFENNSISCALDLSSLDEQQTVDGVLEVLEKFKFAKKDLSLVGHSFGSCPISWLLASKRLQQVKQVVLIDPVSIVLSEPDVMVNFLYSQALDKIRVVASSELFTQCYLRRHFAWYNSELYVEDVDCPMIVCCSERDEIVNSAKVKQEMERHHKAKHNLVCWEGAGHGACIANPTKWKELKGLMLKQELQIVQQKSL